MDKPTPRYLRKIHERYKIPPKVIPHPVFHSHLLFIMMPAKVAWGLFRTKSKTQKWKLLITHQLSNFFLIGIHSMHSWKAIARHGFTRKSSTKRLKHTENPIKKQFQEAARSTSPDMTTAFHARLYCRFIDIEQAQEKQEKETS